MELGIFSFVFSRCATFCGAEGSTRNTSSASAKLLPRRDSNIPLTLYILDWYVWILHEMFVWNVLRNHLDCLTGMSKFFDWVFFLLNMHFLIYVVDRLSLCVPLFVRFSCVLLHNVAAFSTAFAISSDWFSVRLVYVNNHFCNFVELQLHMTWSLILSLSLLAFSLRQASSCSQVTNCSILSPRFCSA